MTDSTKTGLAITNVLDLWPGLGTMIEDACDDTGSKAARVRAANLGAEIAHTVAGELVALAENLAGYVE